MDDAFETLPSNGWTNERGFVDIASTQRLAAYTRDLGIERAKTAGVSKADLATASGRAQSSRSAADASGVQVSLSASAQALSEGTNEGIKRGGNDSTAAAPKPSQPTNRGPQSNRSFAVEAYQKNASTIPGSRIQVIA